MERCQTTMDANGYMDCQMRVQRLQALQCRLHGFGHLLDCDRCQAFPALDDAGLKVAAKAVDLMINDAMLLSGRIPDARQSARREGNDARNPDTCRQMHRS